MFTPVALAARCGSRTYNPLNDMCCQETTGPRVCPHESECCEEGCCGEGDFVFMRDCCHGRTCYDEDDESCCPEGHACPDVDRGGCCGLVCCPPGHDETATDCCQDSTTGEETGCYDSTAQDCCPDGDVVDKGRCCDKGQHLVECGGRGAKRLCARRANTAVAAIAASRRIAAARPAARSMRSAANRATSNTAPPRANAVLKGNIAFPAEITKTPSRTTSAAPKTNTAAVGPAARPATAATECAPRADVTRLSRVRRLAQAGRNIVAITPITRPIQAAACRRLQPVLATRAVAQAPDLASWRAAVMGSITPAVLAVATQTVTCAFPPLTVTAWLPVRRPLGSRPTVRRPLGSRPPRDGRFRLRREHPLGWRYSPGSCTSRRPRLQDGQLRGG